MRQSSGFTDANYIRLAGRTTDVLNFGICFSGTALLPYHYQDLLLAGHRIDSAVRPFREFFPRWPRWRSSPFGGFILLLSSIARRRRRHPCSRALPPNSSLIVFPISVNISARSATRARGIREATANSPSILRAERPAASLEGCGAHLAVVLEGWARLRSHQSSFEARKARTSKRAQCAHAEDDGGASFSSSIEPEMDDVAVGDNIFLAFQPQLAGVRGRRHRAAERGVVGIGDGFGADEALLEESRRWITPAAAGVALVPR